MDTLVVHVLNALLYASVLFLIAGGLSLIYGVMRIMNHAHGNLYAFGAYVSAWIIGYLSTSVAVGEAGKGAPTWVLLALLPAGAVAAAAAGALLEPTLLRPFYKRAEEYQLLVTFGLLMIIDDVIRFLWGPYPLSASVVFENFGSVTVGDTLYPTYNFLVIGVGALAAIFLWAFIYRTRFGIVLRATSQDMRMSGGLGSLEGALLGALIVGIVREAGITWFPEVELAVLYLMAAAVLLVRPAGLFGRA